MSVLKRLVATVGVVLLLLGGITLLALEGQEVVVIRTTAAEGTARLTRVWVAPQGDELWLEAATPERPWYRDVLVSPRVALRRNGHFQAFRAEVVPNPQGHERIRSLLRQKYGLADVWVGFLQDTSRSIAVRLLPAHS